MRLNKIIVFAFCIFMSTLSFGQRCGHVASQIDIDRLFKNKKAVANGINVKSNAPTYIPVTFHIASKTNGDDGVTEDKVAQQLCALNNDYASLDIVFYLKDKKYNYIKSTFFFQNPTENTSGTKMIEEKFNNGANSVNVFICENADTGGLGTTLGYYDPFLDVIVMRKSEINGFAGTLSHEVGHFFSLLHVFNGWDSEVWEAGTHGNPVSSQTSPGGVLNELADGSNCNDSGDFLCDTPADYNLGFSNPGCTPYNGGCKDFNGELLDPDEENFMSYFIGCDQYHFSDDQGEVIFADYNSSDRNFLHVNYTPNTDALSEDVVLEYPINAEVVDGYDHVQLNWNTIDNAVGYVVELKQAINTTKYFTTKSDVLITDLKPGKTYTWKVLAYTEIGGCASFTGSTTFKTGTTTSVNNLEEFNISLTPTIVEGRSVNLDINVSKDASLNLINVSGQVISNWNQYLNNGTNSIALPNSLKTGMYFLNVQIDGKAQSFKLIVQ